MRLLFLLAFPALAACSDVPGQVDGKLLCTHETREAFVASKHLNSVIVKRQEFADPLCKETK